MSFDFGNISDTIIRDRINRKKAINISEAMQTIWKYAYKFLTKA